MLCHWLQATAPDVGGVLTLEAHLGCTAELPVHLAASGPDPQPFQAEFTPESPLNFDVVPAVGTLPPLVANTQSCGNSITPAPLKVTFVCK